MRRVAVQLRQRNHKDAGGLCQFVQTHADTRHRLVTILRPAIRQQLQIVHKNNVRPHSLGLRFNPRGAFARRRFDKQWPLVQLCQKIQLVHRHGLALHIGQRRTQTVGNHTCG